jgi:hypothetical protein
VVLVLMVLFTLIAHAHLGLAPVLHIPIRPECGGGGLPC